MVFQFFTNLFLYFSLKIVISSDYLENFWKDFFLSKYQDSRSVIFRLMEWRSRLKKKMNFIAFRIVIIITYCYHPYKYEIHYQISYQKLTTSHSTDFQNSLVKSKVRSPPYQKQQKHQPLLTMDTIIRYTINTVNQQ